MSDTVTKRALKRLKPGVLLGCIDHNKVQSFVQVICVSDLIELSRDRDNNDQISIEVCSTQKQVFFRHVSFDQYDRVEYMRIDSFIRTYTLLVSVTSHIDTHRNCHDRYVYCDNARYCPYTEAQFASFACKVLFIDCAKTTLLKVVDVPKFEAAITGNKNTEQVVASGSNL